MTKALSADQKIAFALLFTEAVGYPHRFLLPSQKFDTITPPEQYAGISEALNLAMGTEEGLQLLSDPANLPASMDGVFGTEILKATAIVLGAVGYTSEDLDTLEKWNAAVEDVANQLSASTEQELPQQAAETPIVTETPATEEVPVTGNVTANEISALLQYVPENMKAEVTTQITAATQGFTATGKLALLNNARIEEILTQLKDLLTTNHAIAAISEAGLKATQQLQSLPAEAGA